MSSERADQVLEGPNLSLFSIIKSSKKVPGNIFTLEFDYQSRYYSQFIINKDNKQQRSLTLLYNQTNSLPSHASSPSISASFSARRQREQQQGEINRSENDGRGGRGEEEGGRGVGGEEGRDEEDEEERIHKVQLNETFLINKNIKQKEYKNVIPIKKTIKNNFKSLEISPTSPSHPPSSSLNSLPSSPNEREKNQSPINTTLPNNKFSTNFLKGSSLKKEKYKKEEKRNFSPQFQQTQQQQQPLQESFNNQEKKIQNDQSYQSQPPAYYSQSEQQQQQPQQQTQEQNHNSKSNKKNKTDSNQRITEQEDSITTSNQLIPPHVIHNRLMGWKLTSPERRKELIDLFDHIHQENSIDSNRKEEDIIYNQKKSTMTEEEYQEALRIAKRQTEAYEETIK